MHYVQPMKRVERIRLYPTQRQIAGLLFALDVTRELYNAALQERRDAYRSRGIKITRKIQYAELTELRKEDSRIRAVYRECEDGALYRIDLAMAAFFRRVGRGEKAGYPRYRSRRRWRQLEFSHGNRSIMFNQARTKARISGVGHVRVRKGRSVPSKFGRAWIVEKNGRWHLCLEHEVEAAPLRPVATVAGLDFGVHVLVATSGGVLIPNKNSSDKMRRSIARLQRELNSTSQKSDDGRVTNYHDALRIAAVNRLARAREREANARRDYLHKVSRALVDCGADAIGIENLRLRNMTRSAKGTLEKPGRRVRPKAGLNRRLLDASFGLLRAMITYKAASAGVNIVAVDAKFSSQECSQCGHTARESRRRRRFCCVMCGFNAHADTNAALVIRRRAEWQLLKKPMPVRSRLRCAALA